MKLEFTSLVGHQPWFFVPDTGMPGGTAVLTAPDGTKVEAQNTQLDEEKYDWPALGAKFKASRLGFEMPGMFTDPGDYTLVITQENDKGKKVVDTYTIHVRLDVRWLADEAGLGELGRLNQIRTLQNKPVLNITEAATGKGFTVDEIAAINIHRRAQSWALLSQEN